MGYSLRYEYGLFKQKIVDGWQIELPDVWLPGGEAWLTQRTDKSFIVRFNGQIIEKWTKNVICGIKHLCKQVRVIIIGHCLIVFALREQLHIEVLHGLCLPQS